MIRRAVSKKAGPARTHEDDKRRSAGIRRSEDGCWGATSPARWAARRWSRSPQRPIGPRWKRTLAETGEAIEYLQRGLAAPARRPRRGRPSAFRLDADPAEALAMLRIEGACLEAKEDLDLTELLDRATEHAPALASVGARLPPSGARAPGIGEFRPVRQRTRRQDPAGWDTRRSRQRGADPCAPRHREAEEADPGFPRTLPPHTSRRRRPAGRIHYDPQRAFRGAADRGTASAKIDGVIHGSSGSGHTLFRRTARNHRAEQRPGAVDGRGDARGSPHPARDDSSPARAFAPRSHAPSRCWANWICSSPKRSLRPTSIAWCRGSARKTNAASCCARPAIRCCRTCSGGRRKPIMPVTLALDADCRTLLISGPNTGGKTVSLKTVGPDGVDGAGGFPGALHGSGISDFRPGAGRHRRQPVDSGKPQHVLRAHRANPGDAGRCRRRIRWCLLDELGRATDPEEGGALGVAVLERFRAAGAFTLASTHLLALKIYGANTAGVVNGSMGFDERTLEPTYVLKLGAPGKSAGLEIARHLGMPATLIEQARARLGDAASVTSRGSSRNCTGGWRRRLACERNCASRRSRWPPTEKPWPGSGPSGNPPS